MMANPDPRDVDAKRAQPPDRGPGPSRKTALRFLLKLTTKLLLVLLGCLLALGVLEAALRVHNPFETRVRGDRIVLPAGRQYVFDNQIFGNLDEKITHTKNSLGFHGPEPPSNFEDQLTIIAVGGSTTESLYISDGRTWTDVLGRKLATTFDGVWVNNAGLDGHSTYGHLVLTEDYLASLKPDVVLYLIGANDMGRGDLSPYERERIKGGISVGSMRELAKSVAPYSEVVSLGLNYYRTLRAKVRGLTHVRFDLRAVGTVEVAEDQWGEIENRHRKDFLGGFESRLRALVALTRSNGMEPVLVTQPALYGDAIDDLTGVDLGSIAVLSLNGRFAWRILELYNDVTRTVGEREQVLVIDLAAKLPKSSRYFYDLYHYTNEGSEAVAAIIYRSLCPLLAANYQDHLTGVCFGKHNLGP